ncbi:MAG: diadenylate cyclase [Pirellulales bacterium]|nr:diadenylate cyclase [Pirellulales bacterium]
MDIAELVNTIRVVELTAKTRPAAIRALAKSIDLSQEGIPFKQLVKAVEEREATAQTIVDEGFAMPHAIIDWDGDYRIVLGRSRSGVDFGILDSARVYLIALFIVGQQRQKNFHLELLAALAELMESDEFRQEIVQAPDTRAIERLLLAKAGRPMPADKPKRLPSVPRINTILVRQSIHLADTISAQALLITVDKLDYAPWTLLEEWSGRLLVITTQPSDDCITKRPDSHFYDIPHATLARMDRANLGLMLAASDKLLANNGLVVCVTGPGGRLLDSISVVALDMYRDAVFGSKVTKRSTAILPAVVLRALTLAIELAAEGREGQPVGTMFVIGDARQVLRHAQQLILNPFHGYSRTLRNLLDPSLGETIKEFAQVDGAFVVRADGIVLTAGTYLIPKSSSVKLPPGLGTRHQAAAAITAHTQALAIALSQSTGTVTVFRHGQIVLRLERAIPSHS